jgi:tRNA modification GTPase
LTGNGLRPELPMPRAFFLMPSDTIAAIATPAGAGGIGVVKISGPEALQSALPLLRPARDPSDLRSHQLYYGRIVDPDSGKIVDEVLFSVMRAPRSYTKEDVVEIQAHGSRCGLHRILELVLRQGVRSAEPGEFTKRAFLKGRIDLTQAEAVAELISAQTTEGLEIASRHLAGHFRKSIESVQETVRGVLTEVEAAIDFPEDLEEIIQPEVFSRRLEEQIVGPLSELLVHYEEGHIYREGVSAIILGRPNVGKSSLMNRLLQKERSIVTTIPGTTRDFIEETVNVRGIPVRLIDTAGLHETDDVLESMGIQFTKDRLDEADIVLFMVDAGAPVTEEDDGIYQMVRERRTILVVNKVDLPPHRTTEEMTGRFPKLHRVEISALHGQGIEELKATLFSLVTKQAGPADLPSVVPNLRQKLAIEKAVGAIKKAATGFTEQQIELTAIDLKDALDVLGEIVGETAPEDILDRIFNRFCIGK